MWRRIHRDGPFHAHFQTLAPILGELSVTCTLRRPCAIRARNTVILGACLANTCLADAAYTRVPAAR